MIRHPHVTGVVLAGGPARRMGGARKALLPLGADARSTPLARILDVFAGRFAACVLVLAPGETAGRLPETDLPVTVTWDRIPGCGPLGGLHAGLGVAPTRFAFVCGGDMPSLSAALLDHMAERARPGRLLVPVHRGRPEPLHAIYPVSCLPAVEQALREDVRMMLEFFERVAVDYLTKEELVPIEGVGHSFDNINTPEDLEAILRRSSARGRP